MNRSIIALLAATLFAAAVPAFATEHAAKHGMNHDVSNADCAKECDMLLKNCAQDVDTIQQKIQKLKGAIKQEGADQAKLGEIRILKQKLDEAKATLKALEKPGR